LKQLWIPGQARNDETATSADWPIATQSLAGEVYPGGAGLPARALQWQADLFVIWCLEFVFFDIILQGKAILHITPVMRGF